MKQLNMPHIWDYISSAIFSVDELGLDFIPHLFLLGLESTSRNPNKYSLLKLPRVYVITSHPTARAIKIHKK